MLFFFFGNARGLEGRGSQELAREVTRLFGSPERGLIAAVTLLDGKFLGLHISDLPCHTIQLAQSAQRRASLVPGGEDD